MPAGAFYGSIPGYVFKLGPWGLGYYLDLPPAPSTAAIAQQQLAQTRAPHLADKREFPGQKSAHQKPPLLPTAVRSTGGRRFEPEDGSYGTKSVLRVAAEPSKMAPRRPPRIEKQFVRGGVPSSLIAFLSASRRRF